MCVVLSSALSIHRIVFPTLCTPGLLFFNFRRWWFPYIGVFVIILVSLLRRWLHIDLAINDRLLKLVFRRFWPFLLLDIISFLDIILLVLLIGHILVLIKSYWHVMMLKWCHLTEMSLHTLSLFFWVFMYLGYFLFEFGRLNEIVILRRKPRRIIVSQT